MTPCGEATATLPCDGGAARRERTGREHRDRPIPPRRAVRYRAVGLRDDFVQERSRRLDLMEAADPLPRGKAGPLRVRLDFPVRHHPSLGRDHELLGERPDLAWIGFVFRDVPVLERAERLARVAPRADRLVLLGAHERFAITARGRGLGRGDETSADDRALGSERERRDDAAAVDDAARGDHRDLHRIDDLRHERERPDPARVPACPGALRRDDGGPGRLGPYRMLHLPGHHHDRDAVSVHLRHVRLRDRKAGDEDLDALVVEDRQVGHDHLRQRREQVDGERLLRQRLRLPDLLPQVVGREVRRAHHPEAAGVRDGRHERRHRHAAHAGEDHRDVDAEKVADRCAERPGGHFTLTRFARPWESATGSTRHMPMPAERRRIQPVLIGGGQTIDRPEDPTAGKEPLLLMEEAARRAAEDAGGGVRLLAAVDTVAVPTVVGPAYGDAAGLLAERLGCPGARRLNTTLGGNTPQALVNHLADEIAAGRVALAVVAGAEAWHPARALGRAGRRIPWTPPRAEDAPRWGDGRPGSSELEIRHGAAQPIATYPLFENAFRAARGLDLEAHRRELGAFAARSAALAARNPHAWFPDGKSAAQLGAVTAENRMIGF